MPRTPKQLAADEARAHQYLYTHPGSIAFQIADALTVLEAETQTLGLRVAQNLIRRVSEELKKL